MSCRVHRSPSSRGYTIVELLMSLSVLAIGVAGVLGMQRVTISSNQHAKNLSLATRIAQGWIDELAADATLWTVRNGASTLAGSTTWLNVVQPNQIWGWNVPAYSLLRRFGPGFDALGSPVDHTTNPGGAHFCTQIRLAFVRPELAGGTLTDTGVIRTQVRVFWRRDDSLSTLGGAAAPGAGNLCAVTGAELDADLDPVNGGNSFHVIYLTSAVRETPSQ